MKLINSYCLSSLLFNLEIFDLTKYQINNLAFVVNRLCIKIFRTTNMENINFCLYNFGFLPINLILYIRKCKYLKNLLNKKDFFSELFFRDIENELDHCIDDWKKFGNSFSYPCKDEAWEIFHEKVFGLPV